MDDNLTNGGELSSAEDGSENGIAPVNGELTGDLNGGGAGINNAGNIRPISIEDEMRSSYLDYAMSVIVARALPDARDGLKPVHRRILYAMHDMGLQPNTSYKKSARIVGEVLGKYHPHGDTAVYDAMARMAQDFSLRYPLVDGQGNFGSIDGDSPAAMRYTEARLAPIAAFMLQDIDMDTVDWATNFDDSLQEPTVLPGMVPNLLVNGTSGIAVGMATNIPPHNLSEIADAVIFMIDNWERHDEIGLDELMEFVKGPDFPTGGIILGTEGIRQAFATGRGKVRRARQDRDRRDPATAASAIIVTEIPYQVNKTTLIERIAELVRGGRLDQISDLRDESDRTGMRIVIELKRGAAPKKVRNQLFKSTALAVLLRRQHAGAGQWPAGHAEPASRADHLHRASRRGADPAHRISAGQGPRTRPHSRRAAHCAGIPGRGDPHHSPERQRRRCTHGADGALWPLAGSGPGDPGHAAATPGRAGTAAHRG